MSYIANAQGKTFNAGFFLAHEECTRETHEIMQSLATTESDGTKYVKAGTIYPSNDTHAIGIVYEDTDVTNGNVAGSVVTKGEVIEGRLPVALDSDAKTALGGLGFVFVGEGEAIRPEYPAELTELTVTSSAGTNVGDTVITVAGYSLKAGETYKYKVASDTAPSLLPGELPDSTWTAWDGEDDITAATGKKITIVVLSAFGEAKASGNATVTAKAAG